jgi:hypothetical protein
MASRLRRSKDLRIGLCEELLFLSNGKQFPLARTEPTNWRASVDLLPLVLESFKNQKASVVIADQFVRYTLLPWSDTLKTHAQWLALARHRFCSVHGPVANGWEIKFAETAPAGPRLACAVDSELVDELAARFNGSGVQLVSVLPFLVAAFNQVRNETGGSCWLVIEEPGRLTLALFLKGVWVAIRSRRCDAGWREGLRELIERESAFLGLEEPCTRVIVCAQGPFEAAEYEDFRLHALNYQELALAA